MKKMQQKVLEMQIKVLLLHPQQRKALFEIPQRKRIERKEIFKKKDSEKLAGKEKAFYICTPQNTESSLKDWKEKLEKGSEKKASKIF